MRAFFVTAAAVAAFATAATAQPATDGGPNAFQPPVIGGPNPHPLPPIIPMGPMMGGEMTPHHPAPPPKGARFRFSRGDNTIDVRCADDEPTRACVDATVTLLDKLNAMRGSASGGESSQSGGESSQSGGESSQSGGGSSQPNQ